jgi:hypothetical protein
MSLLGHDDDYYYYVIIKATKKLKTKKIQYRKRIYIEHVSILLLNSFLVYKRYLLLLSKRT